MTSLARTDFVLLLLLLLLFPPLLESRPSNDDEPALLLLLELLPSPAPEGLSPAAILPRIQLPVQTLLSLDYLTKKSMSE